MRGLWNKFLNLSILKKSLLAIYTSVAIIFILLISILIHIGDQYSRENSLSSQNEILESAILYIQKEQNYLKGIADNIALLPTVQTQLQQNDPERYDSLSEYLSSLLVQNSGVISAALYDLDGNVAGYYSIDASHDPVDQHAELPSCRFHDIFSNISGSAWSYIPQGSTSFAAVDNSPKMVYWRIISDAKTTKPVGAIAVSMDSRRLLGSNNPPVTPFSRAIVVLDNTGEQVYNRTGLSLSADTTGKMLALSQQTQSPQVEFDISGTSYDLLFSSLGGTDFTVFYIGEHLSSLWKDESFVVFSLLGILFALLLLFPILSIITRMLTAPLAKLDRSMQRFSSGDFSASVDYDRNDEIGRLCQTFNKMVQDNKALIERTYVLQLKEQEAELNLLQAQINPHFLYNLIQTIQWKALRHGEKEIAVLANSMGQIFRISLNRGENIIPLFKEEELINYYLDLQKMRLETRLTYFLDFSDDARKCVIPKLIIQPLVENAVVHGVEQSEQPVHIQVRCWMETSDHLIISVSDNGPGISQEVLCLLPDRLPKPEGKSSGSRFALKNIYDRLKLMYGDRFSMDIQSEAYSLTSVTLRLPITPQTTLPESKS